MQMFRQQSIPKTGNKQIFCEFVSAENELSDSNTKQSEFQDDTIAMTCFGHCGSKIMQLLINKTNLKYLGIDCLISTEYSQKFRNQMFSL